MKIEFFDNGSKERKRKMKVFFFFFSFFSNLINVQTSINPLLGKEETDFKFCLK